MNFHQDSSSYRSSPRWSPAGGIENVNKLAARPVVRQSKIYRNNESGNAMKGIFGQDHLAWDTNNQQGVFEGQGVFDASAGTYTSESMLQTGADEIEYPLPGSTASCDSCGSVVDRYYHCADCLEETGLFDLCTECCAAIYLKQSTPRAMANARPPNHATHNYSSHRMIHIAIPGS